MIADKANVGVGSIYRYFKGRVEQYVVSMEVQAVNLIDAIERGNVAQLRGRVPGA